MKIDGSNSFTAFEIGSSDPLARKYPNASIVITTKNRVDEVLIAVRSAVEQTESCEVILVDDGSEDGTAEAVKEAFPSVRVFRSTESLGLIVQRNFAISVARGEFVFTLDDDAVFSSNKLVAEVLAEFGSDSIGIVAIPMVNVPGTKVFQRAPSTVDEYITFPFKGGANAIRRSVFESLGGYRTVYHRQGEEHDFSIRMLESGWLIRLSNASLIEHHPSPKRNLPEIFFYSRRNDIVYGWLNVPTPRLPGYTIRQILETLIMIMRKGHVRVHLKGMWSGFIACWSLRNARSPVALKTFLIARQLEKSEAVSMGEVLEELKR